MTKKSKNPNGSRWWLVVPATIFGVPILLLIVWAIATALGTTYEWEETKSEVAKIEVLTYSPVATGVLSQNISAAPMYLVQFKTKSGEYVNVTDQISARTIYEHFHTGDSVRIVYIQTKTETRFRSVKIDGGNLGNRFLSIAGTSKGGPAFLLQYQL